MTFRQTVLDLSLLPPPAVLELLDSELIIASLKADFVQRYPEFSADLESEPIVKLFEAVGYREMLLRTRVNDAALAGLVSYALGSDLDHLADNYSIALPGDVMLKRHVIVPATNNQPAIMESNEDFRRRVLLAPEAFSSAGAPGAYIFHALNADSRILNVDVLQTSPGFVSIAVQSREGDGLASPELIDVVKSYLDRPGIRPLTDFVTIRSVVNIPYVIQLEALVLRGPDALTIKALVEQSVLKMAKARRTPSRDVPRSAVFAAAHVPPVDRVVLSNPVQDVATDFGEVGVLTGLIVAVTSYDG